MLQRGSYLFVYEMGHFFRSSWDQANTVLSKVNKTIADKGFVSAGEMLNIVDEVYGYKPFVGIGKWNDMIVYDTLGDEPKQMFHLEIIKPKNLDCLVYTIVPTKEG